MIEASDDATWDLKKKNRHHNRCLSVKFTGDGADEHCYKVEQLEKIDATYDIEDLVQKFDARCDTIEIKIKFDTIHYT